VDPRRARSDFGLVGRRTRGPIVHAVLDVSRPRGAGRHELRAIPMTPAQYEAFRALLIAGATALGLPLDLDP
jgi:hypothetical protein